MFLYVCPSGLALRTLDGEMVERGPTVGEYKAMTQRGGGCCEGGGGWGEGGDIQFSLQIHLVMEGIEMLWFVHRQGLLLSCVRRCSMLVCIRQHKCARTGVIPGMGVCAHARMHMCVNGMMHVGVGLLAVSRQISPLVGLHSTALPMATAQSYLPS